MLIPQKPVQRHYVSHSIRGNELVNHCRTITTSPPKPTTAHSLGSIHTELFGKAKETFCSISSSVSIGGSARDARPPPRRNFFNFMQFFLGKLAKITGWRTPSGKSWIRHWPVWIIHYKFCWRSFVCDAAFAIGFDHCEQCFTSADGVVDWMQLLKHISITILHACEHVCARVPLMHARWFMRARGVSDYFANSRKPMNMEKKD